MRRLFRPSAAALLVGAPLVVATGAALPEAHATASAATCRATIVGSGVSSPSLQRAIRQADPGGTIRVVGRCVGTFVVRRDLTLRGRATAASPRPTLDAAGAGRVLRTLGDETDLTVVDLRVTGGRAELGGGVRSGRGQLVLRRSTVRGNVAGDSGGGVYSRGELRVRHTSIDGNRARFGGGIFLDGGSARLSGGSSVAHNVASYAGGNTPAGGGIYSDGGRLLIKDTASVTANRGLGAGGGIFTSKGSELSMTGSSTVGGNVATWEGGGVANRGTVTMSSGSSIRGNDAGRYGGGVFNTGTVTMGDAATIRGNRVSNAKEETYGGGVYNVGTVVMNGTSSVRHNSAGYSGGGIEQEVGVVVMNDSASIVGNFAGWYGGGIYSDDAGVSMNGSSSITANTAANGVGGGIFAYLGSLSGVTPGGNVRDNSPDDVYQAPALSASRTARRGSGGPGSG